MHKKVLTSLLSFMCIRQVQVNLTARFNWKTWSQLLFLPDRNPLRLFFVAFASKHPCVLSLLTLKACPIILIIRKLLVLSATAAIEGINYIATGNLIAVSEQELVDCATQYNRGGNGGSMDYAFEFVVENGGIDSGGDYPYMAAQGSCDESKV